MQNQTTNIDGQIAKVLSEMAETNVYICFQQEILDFTDSTIIPEIKIFNQDGKIMTLMLNDQILPILIPMLKLTILGKNNKIIVWNWKNFVSYILKKTSKSILSEGAIIDLKIIESYAGKKLKAPKGMVEALNRLKDLIISGVWKEVEKIYKNIHLPLITTVIPHLETVGILDMEKQKRVYAYYEIDGQDNGRLKCSNGYNLSYIPHVLKPEDRKNLKPRFDNELFMVFDFKGQEVYQLAWMSQDPLLLELCQSSDVYLAIYEKVTGKKCEGKNERELAKKFFLPVIYGQSAYSLSQRCGIAIDVAEIILDRIDTLFPVALAFIGSYQKQLQELGYAKDIFGKRRINFEEGKEYSVRNFANQSPAAVVCLEKLINLYFALKDKTDLAYSVHDGYAVYATKENWKTIYKIGYEVLSGDSEFCPGLRLRVTCKAGRNLGNLKTLNQRG